MNLKRQKNYVTDKVVSPKDGGKLIKSTDTGDIFKQKITSTVESIMSIY